MSPALHVVLLEPEIPQNTGSVGRLCVGTGCALHLVRPLGFDISEKAVRRAGLDYWKDVDLAVHDDLAACRAAIRTARPRWFWFSAHATRPYTTVAFAPGDVLVFGRETDGLPEPLERAAEADGRLLAIPRFGPIRSLNLANAVSVAVYEALRQLRPKDFPGPAEYDARPLGTER